MAVAKKDQERATYAWMYGAQAQKDSKERAAPPYWQEHADVWLQGFDGELSATRWKPRSTKPPSSGPPNSHLAYESVRSFLIEEKVSAGL
ncbi:hypothetical protein ACYG9R_09125 [Mesorhizobium sp. RSR565B]|uniref:hypothetical protein n=1 Tax=Mesorhizobium sp. L103C565B0 TaxID=1287094 RepID=UPI0004217CCE|nr:hypothetical protein [Mesorhizobium sp. L103C565B0]